MHFFSIRYFVSEMKQVYDVLRINIFLHCHKTYIYLSHSFLIFARDNNLEVISKMILSEIE